jgi:hypothetical protein
MEDTIPIRFELPTLDSRAVRPNVEFSSVTGALCIGKDRLPVTVRGRSKSGWVFCGLDEDNCGDYLRVTGGSVTLVSGWSGDDGNVEFIVTHDGVSPEILIYCNTRAD